MSAPCCPACSRQFGDANAVRNHHNMKHKKRTPLPKTWGDDHEPSMAELFVDDQWEHYQTVQQPSEVSEIVVFARR